MLWFATMCLTSRIRSKRTIFITFYELWKSSRRKYKTIYFLIKVLLEKCAMKKLILLTAENLVFQTLLHKFNLFLFLINKHKNKLKVNKHFCSFNTLFCKNVCPINSLFVNVFISKLLFSLLMPFVCRIFNSIIVLLL